MEFLSDTLKYIGIIFMVLMVFNLMILVHEWGHFLAARWRGLKVEKFQIWFGSPIWKKTYNGVQYGLGWIPAGGFVALPQMAPMDAIEGGNENREVLPPISPLDKIIVAFAGPLFSFMLACCFAVIVWQVGKPEQETNATTTIGYVRKDTPADRAGLKPGDVILSIDDQPVHRFNGLVDSIKWLIIASQGEFIQFKVDRPGEGEKLIAVKAEKAKPAEESWWKKIFRRPELRSAGISGKYTPLVDSVEPYSPALDAGIKTGDIFLTANGLQILHPIVFDELADANAGKAVALEVERDGKKVSLTLTPRLPDQRPAEWKSALSGVNWASPEEIVHPKPWSQIRDALRTMRETIAAITSAKSDLGVSHLSGPVGIVHVYTSFFENEQWWRLIFWFSVVLNVNLAVMNMLPFPVLDGGHITMALYEWVRRRPINIRILEVVQTACVLVLLSFMAFVTLKDTGDWAGRSKREALPQIELKFLPPAERPVAAPAN
ncbi:RIP metalloprotease RseP [soil metagenome]